MLVEAAPELFMMFKPKLRHYAKKALEERGVEVLVGELVELGRADAGHAEVRQGARGPHARLGRRPAGESARRFPRPRAAEGQPHRCRARPQHRRPSRGLRSRRHRVDHRHEDGRRAAAARLGRAPGGRARGREHRPPRRGQGDEALPLSRQGHDGDHRPRRSGRSAGTRKDDEGRAAWLAWGAVHLSLLSTGEDRAKAVVDWTWAGFTHERASRISIDA